MAFDTLTSAQLLGSWQQLRKELWQLAGLNLPGCTEEHERRSLREKLSLIERTLAKRGEAVPGGNQLDEKGNECAHLTHDPRGDSPGVG